MKKYRIIQKRICGIFKCAIQKKERLKMKCTDCENYYLGCDTEVFNYGYEQDKAEECEFFLEIESIE